jgi:aquaporin Z
MLEGQGESRQLGLVPLGRRYESLHGLPQATGVWMLAATGTIDSIDSMGRGTASRVPGRAGAEIIGTGVQGGWHWAEWTCEFVGTALLLLGGLSAVCLDFAPGSPVAPTIPDHSARLLITGLLFAGTGSLVAVSRLGRRSGAHLNPSVTLAFWVRGHMHVHDLAGYTLAQIAGAFAGTALVRWWWGTKARAVDLGVTRPGHGVGAGAVSIEAFMTFLLVAGILVMVSFPRTARWTPLLVWILVAVLVWQGAPWTGTSLNPARSLAPALLAPHTAYLWVYLAGPLAGSLVAVAVFDAVPGLETRTAKLFHDPRYPSTMATTLPVAPRRA